MMAALEADVRSLRGALGEPGAGTLFQHLGALETSLAMAKILTGGMLALTRGDGVMMHRTDIARTLESVEASLRRLLPPSILLRILAAPGLFAHSHDGLLQSSLLNLALNARDAMANGGALLVTARLRWFDDPTHHTIGVLKPGPYVEIRVADNGTGISPAILGRVFDPQFSTKPPGAGAGLGLTVVREFALGTGAGVDLHSRWGEGTEVRLLLPAASPVERWVRPGNREARVLVVDGDPESRAALCRDLMAAGLRPEPVAVPEAALTMLAVGQKVDLVLGDAAGLGMGGLAMHERLAQERPDLPVVLIAGSAEVFAAAVAVDPVPVVIRKPVDLAELIETVRGLV